TNDLTSVHLGVKFSCLQSAEIQEAVKCALLTILLSCQAMRQLHPEAIKAHAEQSAFSKAEEQLLSKTSQPSLDTFQDLLHKHPEIFYPPKTAKVLQTHWQLMKQYYLLDDQTVQPLPKGDQVLNFSDAEDMIDDSKLKTDCGRPRQKRMSSPDFDNQTLAVLRGRMVRYLMRSREITLGRATKDNQIDVDLALEGPAWKISRKQACFVFLINQDLIALIKAEAAKIAQP
ncbi:hypothetical protein E2320_016279, partial [Naja naja]